jgi:hypothetical protein
MESKGVRRASIVHGSDGPPNSYWNLCLRHRLDGDGIATPAPSCPTRLLSESERNEP